MVAIKDCGQATVEFIFILAFGIFLGLKMRGSLTSFFSDQAGSVAHVLSTHLTVGVCPTRCFFKGYQNGFR